MARQKEGRLSRDIREALEKYIGGVWSKIHVSEFQEPGIADNLGCVQGLHIEVETKRPGYGRLRQTQILRQTRIIEAGGAYVMATSPDEAVYLVGQWLRRHGKKPKHRDAGLEHFVAEKKPRRIVGEFRLSVHRKHKVRRVA